MVRALTEENLISLSLHHHQVSLPFSSQEKPWMGRSLRIMTGQAKRHNEEIQEAPHIVLVKQDQTSQKHPISRMAVIPGVRWARSQCPVGPLTPSRWARFRCPVGPFPLSRCSVPCWPVGPLSRFALVRWPLSMPLLPISKAQSCGGSVCRWSWTPTLKHLLLQLMPIQFALEGPREENSLLLC